MARYKEQAVPVLEERIAYHFRDSNLAWKTCQTKGADGSPEGNKRLALLGDALLRSKLIQMWYPTGNRTQAGQNIVSRIARNVHLTKIGRDLGLVKCINSNPSQKGVVTDSQVADTVEAIIGAVFLDGGLEASDRVMKRLGVLDSPAA